MGDKAYHCTNPKCTSNQSPSSSSSSSSITSRGHPIKVISCTNKHCPLRTHMKLLLSNYPDIDHLPINTPLTDLCNPVFCSCKRYKDDFDKEGNIKDDSLNKMYDQLGHCAICNKVYHICPLDACNELFVMVEKDNPNQIAPSYFRTFEKHLATKHQFGIKDNEKTKKAAGTAAGTSSSTRRVGVATSGAAPSLNGSLTSGIHDSLSSSSSPSNIVNSLFDFDDQTYPSTTPSTSTDGDQSHALFGTTAATTGSNARGDVHVSSPHFNIDFLDGFDEDEAMNGINASCSLADSGIGYSANSTSHHFVHSSSTLKRNKEEDDDKDEDPSLVQPKKFSKPNTAGIINPKLTNASQGDDFNALLVQQNIMRSGIEIDGAKRLSDAIEQILALDKNQVSPSSHTIGPISSLLYECIMNPTLMHVFKLSIDDLSALKPKSQLDATTKEQIVVKSLATVQKSLLSFVDADNMIPDVRRGSIIFYFGISFGKLKKMVTTYIKDGDTFFNKVPVYVELSNGKIESILANVKNIKVLINVKSNELIENMKNLLLIDMKEIDERNNYKWYSWRSSQLSVSNKPIKWSENSPSIKKERFNSSSPRSTDETGSNKDKKIKGSGDFDNNKLVEKVKQDVDFNTKLVNLSSKKLDDEKLISIIPYLGTNIEKLVISYNNLKDHSMSVLSEYLKTNNVIQLLDLSGNQITNNGMRNLFPGLLANKSLLTLCFGMVTKIDDDILDELILVIKMSSLKKITCNSCGLSSQGTKSVLKALQYPSRIDFDITHLVRQLKIIEVKVEQKDRNWRESCIERDNVRKTLVNKIIILKLARKSTLDNLCKDKDVCSDEDMKKTLSLYLERQIYLHNKRQKITKMEESLAQEKKMAIGYERDFEKTKGLLQQQQKDSQIYRNIQSDIQSIEKKRKLLKENMNRIMGEIAMECKDEVTGEYLFPELLDISIVQSMTSPRSSLSAASAATDFSQAFSSTLSTQSILQQLSISHLRVIESAKSFICENISHGYFSKIYKVKLHINGKENSYAFKEFNVENISERDVEHIKNEILLLDLKHENILKAEGVIKELFLNDSGDKKLGFGMILEYCSNDTLQNYIKRYKTTPNASIELRILQQIASGIAYLHSHTPKCIVHQDVNTRNILLDDHFNAKITGFSHVKIGTPTSLTKIHYDRAVNYIAPETVIKDTVTDKSDVYSFGCIIFEMFNGSQPWDGCDFERIKNMHYQKEILVCENKRFDNSLSFSFRKIAGRCLSYEADRRPLMDQVVEEIKKAIPPIITDEILTSSEEYKRIEKLFFPDDPQLQGTLNRKSYRITKIESINNSYTESLYQTQVENIKREMESALLTASIYSRSRINKRIEAQANPNERLLFHGTSQSSPLAMCTNRDGFLKEFSNPNGFYGAGFYFAELARYSNRGFSYNKSNGTKQLLVCSVVCGNSEEKGFDIDPNYSQSKLASNKHSIHAGPHSPEQGAEEDASNIFVVYKEAQVTFRYLITYQSI